MKKHLLTLLILLGLILVPAFPAEVNAQAECPAVAADGPGVERIEGQGTYSFYGIPTIIVDQPVVALIDDSLATQGDRDSFPPNQGQVIGVITSDFFSSPFSYTINLPTTGSGVQVNLDQDGDEDAGVQVYQVVLAQNVLNTVPLVGIAQGAILSSYYRDEETHEIVEGTLVVYAPDDQQGFPCGYGEDGKLFTEDDPIVALPQGFTIANIADSTITFDRSQVARVEIAESPGSATPSFADQGILESFNTLIDFLRERYVFTEFNDIDWDALYATYAPNVEAADAAGDLPQYYVILTDLAHDLADAHVYVQPGDTVRTQVGINAFLAAFGGAFGGVGAGLVELNDGRIIVSSVNDGGPAAAVGFVFGTEIVTVDGLPVAEALAQPIRLDSFPGTPESKRIAIVNRLLGRYPGTPIEVGYRLPDSSEVMTATMTTVSSLATQSEEPIMPMEYKLVEGLGYVTWSGFERTGIATHIFADFVKVMNERQIPGIIIDVRGNGGGSALMEYAIMSYLFSEAQPLSFSIADNYTYDDLTGEFVRSPQTLTLANAPTVQPYLGDVVVLIDSHCASACEFMSYWLAASGRATIVGQYASEGAGGNTNAVILPGNIQFNYTAGTILDNETDLPAFQGVGVQPNVRVPVTEETEAQKQAGGDPVLETGVAHLRRLAFERLDHQPVTFISDTVTSVVPTGWVASALAAEYVSPDQTMHLAITAWTATDDTDPDTIIINAHPGARKAGEVATDAGTWSVYAVEESNNYVVYGVTVIDDQPYIVSITSADENLIVLMAEFVFLPALREFAVVE